MIDNRDVLAATTRPMSHTLQRLDSHDAYLKEEVGNAPLFGRIVGRSRALRQVLQQVDDVASSGSTVLITGESCTGKDLLARELHERSRRSQRPFVRVNCSAIPREMFESEFFGHVRGAFTGATRDRPGRFQIANGELLGINPTTLASRLRALKITPPKAR